MFAPLMLQSQHTGVYKCLGCDALHWGMATFMPTVALGRAVLPPQNATHSTKYYRMQCPVGGCSAGLWVFKD